MIKLFMLTIYYNVIIQKILMKHKYALKIELFSASLTNTPLKLKLITEMYSRKRVRRSIMKKNI